MRRITTAALALLVGCSSPPGPENREYRTITVVDSHARPVADAKLTFSSGEGGLRISGADIPNFDLSQCNGGPEMLVVVPILIIAVPVALVVGQLPGATYDAASSSNFKANARGEITYPVKSARKTATVTSPSRHASAEYSASGLPDVVTL